MTFKLFCFPNAERLVPFLSAHPPPPTPPKPPLQSPAAMAPPYPQKNSSLPFLSSPYTVLSRL